jgi:DNA-binding transcriptional regulator GbsR (MarR family)
MNELSSRWSATIDSFGLKIGAAMGWPPMGGRMTAILMLSEKPLTVAELREELHASAGSVSETTRILIEVGVIERVKVDGSRQHAFQWRRDAWVGCARHQVDQLLPFLELATTALQEDGRFSPEQQQRFQRMFEYYTHMVASMDAIAREIEAMFAETGTYTRA